MKTLIIFDSFFGNTEKIGRAIAKAFSSNEHTVIKRCKEAAPKELAQFELIIAGSPTRGFRPTEEITNLLKGIGTNGLTNCQVAVFDTRVVLEMFKSKLLRKTIDTGGYAANKLARVFKKKGASLIIEPEGFFVMDTEGPLKEGELERAEKWGKTIREKYLSAL